MTTLQLSLFTPLSLWFNHRVLASVLAKKTLKASGQADALVGIEEQAVDHLQEVLHGGQASISRRRRGTAGQHRTHAEAPVKQPAITLLGSQPLHSSRIPAVEARADAEVQILEPPLAKRVIVLLGLQLAGRVEGVELTLARAVRLLRHGSMSAEPVNEDLAPRWRWWWWCWRW